MDKRKRLISNGIIMAIIVAMGVSMAFTVNGAKNSLAGDMPQAGQHMQKGDGKQPPDMPRGDSQQGDQNGQNGHGDGKQPPDMPGDDNKQGGQDSGMNDNQQGDQNGQNGHGDGKQPPEMPGDDNQQGGQDRGMNGNQQGNQGSNHGGPGKGGMQGPPDMQDQSISGKYYALFGAEALVMALMIAYLICSGVNSRTIAETFRGSKRKAAFIIAAVILAGGITAADVAIASSHDDNGMPAQMQHMDADEKSKAEEAQGATVVDGEEQTLNENYNTSDEDTSAILVKNGGSMTLDGATVTKTGDSTSTEDSEFYGINAGILTTSGSTSKIKGSTISTDAGGSNAVFATGTDAKVYISDSKITTTGERSARGLDATYGGYIEADNVEISTQGGSCATLATDRGEGTVIATNSKLSTAGAGSPLIYSTGDITVSDSTGAATGAQIACIEGKNSATVENSKLTASGAGNRGEVDKCGVFIYQSMSGDASEGTGTFTSTDSVLSIDEDSDYYDNAPMFLVTNTDAVINLTNTELNFGSGVLLNVTATDEWGEEGSNGGDVQFTATDQVLKGDINVDEISTLELSLEDGSTFEGAINTDNSGKEVTLKISSDSKVKLTGDTYVTSLEDEDSDYGNIDFNGYKLYVNGKAI